MSETRSNPSPEVPDFYRQFGQAVVSWNRAEQAVRELLANMAAGTIHSLLNPMAIILTSELGSRGVSQALQSVADQMPDGDKKDAVLHLAVLFDTILEYRNYYVHGITSVVKPETSTDAIPVGLVNHTSAKNKVKLHMQEIGLTEVENFAEWVLKLERFAVELRFHLYFPLGEPPPLPSKPSVPKRLEKQHRLLRELQRPHQS